MGHPGIWRWTLFVCLSWMFVQAAAEPQYLVAVPSELEAGAETQFCLSLLQPNEPLLITVTLTSEEEETILLKTTSSVELHECYTFQAPLVKNYKLHNFKVKVEGDEFLSEEVRMVWVKDNGQMTYVQTDKPLYLPGQTVHFRVFTLDHKFRPADELYNTIEIMDSKHNRLRQWMNTTSNGKILQLSYSLNSEACEGGWKVQVGIGERKIYHIFKVEKYVLPKFDVKIKASNEICVGQEEIEVEVCAKYTYGQPVPGSVSFKTCRPLKSPVELDITEPCYKETKKTEQNGCARFNFDMSTFTKLDPKALWDRLLINAVVKEEGTGIEQSQGTMRELSYVVGKLFFIDTPRFYDKGSIVEGKVKMVTFKNEPVPDMPVYLLHDWWGIHLLQNLMTDSNGIAPFTLNMTNFENNVFLKASLNEDPEQYSRFKGPHYETGNQQLSLVLPSSPDTKSSSSLKVKTKNDQLPCDKEDYFSILYTFVGDTRSAVDVMYLVLSRGNIAMQGHQKVEVQNEPVTDGKIIFTLKVTPDLAPEFQVVAYAVLPNEIVIADSAIFQTEKCFSHKVSLAFSPTSAIPGEGTTLQVLANPGSLCGVSAVDQSVLIDEPGKTLDAEKIFKLLPEKRDYIDDPKLCINVKRTRRSSEDGGHEVFVKLGLKIVTNMFTRMPSCLNFKGTIYDENGNSFFIDRSGIGMDSLWPSVVIKSIRTFFPETWIWKLVEVGESGSTDLSLTVPDTITTWETEAFCLSPQGFGLAPRETLTVFQPFFLELDLPYSIIRGEQFDLKATVFNYLSSCIMVTVTPAASTDFTLTPLVDQQYTSCLCATERKTFRWTMSPSVLGVVNVTISAEAVASHVSCDNEIVSVPDRGRIDVVTRTLIVKAEGTETTKTFNWLLCPNGEALTEEVELQLPDNVIDGSARASLSVLGDIMGRALKNLDGLLQMPYGCGEQNMALLAPNIYILEYLKNTQQLTYANKEKIEKFLMNGYQRQLNYKHYDGSYSVFEEGKQNSWLTAFVLRSFVKASSFVFIDTEVVEMAMRWIESKQRENGCFKQSGKLFNNKMKGGVSDQVTLSAYITASLLEMNITGTPLVVQRSLSCLRESMGNLSNTYTTALLAYVFTLAGDMQTRALLLKHLGTVAIQQGDLLHWSQNEEDTSTSLSVEISSYVLLALLSASPSAEDLRYSSSIVRWLTGQQNQYGGFSSTQDTVVALQALSLYSTKVFNPEGSSTVTVQAPSGQLTFDVNPHNKLLYQEEALKDMTGKYSLEVKGTACASVQISLQYNIPPPPPASFLSVAAEPHADCTSTSRSLSLTLKSVHYGSDNMTNMMIMEIKLLSGFTPDAESLRMIRDSKVVERLEYTGDRILVYIRELLKSKITRHFLILQRKLPVRNLKPALVKIYDYYQPSYSAEFEYAHPCATE
ncbi:alpha-2-macroglobulin isoform X2 [Labrus bergylta]|uniref:alpha-2-macroglobulin isoform X2 n=1 Tax=Labrus bergylta TaxID=56723 RepID=UPI00331397F1